MVRRLQVAVDCADPDRLAGFWVSVLGYVLDTPPVGYTSWRDFSAAFRISLSNCIICAPTATRTRDLLLRSSLHSRS
jgi:Glyoxalase-like domain